MSPLWAQWLWRAMHFPCRKFLSRWVLFSEGDEGGMSINRIHPLHPANGARGNEGILEAWRYMIEGTATMPMLQQKALGPLSIINPDAIQNRRKASIKCRRTRDTGSVYLHHSTQSVWANHRETRSCLCVMMIWPFYCQRMIQGYDRSTSPTSHRRA